MKEIDVDELTPVKKIVISLADNNPNKLRILVFGLLETCPGVKVYADGETYQVIHDILVDKPGQIKGGELHNMRFEPLDDDIDLAIIDPCPLSHDLEKFLSQPAEIDDKRFNLIMTMATNWQRTLILVSPGLDVYKGLIDRLRGNNGALSARCRLLNAYESMNFLRDQLEGMMKKVNTLIT